MMGRAGWGNGAMEYHAVGDAFWRFSLALYARPGIAGALVAMQDRTGADVNLVLFGLWLGASRGCLLAAADLAAAEAAIAPLTTNAVAPLRQLRRHLKQAADSDLQALRRRVAGLEIAAERRVQYRLAASLPAAGYSFEVDRGLEGNRLAAAKGNLALMLGEASGSPEAVAICRAVAALIGRA